MSRYSGWLARFIMMHGTPAQLTIKQAAKCASIRPDGFIQALRDPKLVRLDAKSLGIDPDDWRAMRDWLKSYEADKDVEASMVNSAAAVKRTPSSDRYKGGPTRLGITRPSPPNTHRDHLNLPVNPIEHPEPDGEWHAGLNAAG